MDDHVRSFLDDILAHPHDDAPRLIFADWIDDHADALPAEVRDRGQLIRVQYAQEGLDEDDPRRPMLQTRAAALIHQHQAAWTEGFDLQQHRPTFRRGFVEGVTIYTDHPTQPAARRVPLRRVKLYRYRGGWPSPYEWAYEGAPASPGPGKEDVRLAVESTTIPLLRQVEDLDLSEFQLPEDGYRPWFEAAPLDGLTTLAAREAPLGAAFRTSRLNRLKNLTVVGAVTDDRWRQAGLPPVESLCLPHYATLLRPWLDSLSGSLRRLRAPNRNVAKGALALLTPAAAARLEELDLSEGRRIDLRWLEREGPFPSLRRLILKSCEFPVNSWRHLSSKAFPALRSLNLRNSQLNDAAIRYLAESAPFGQLEALHLGYNKLRMWTADALAPRLPHGLRTLDLSWNPIGTDAVGALATSAAAATLQMLDLSYCSLGPDAARHLATLPPEGGLIALNLGTNRIGAAGLRELLDSPAVGRLEALDVSNNHLNDDAADALLAWPRLRDVSLLAVHGNDLSDAALDRLRGGFRGLLL